MLKLDLYRNNNESSTKYGRVYSRVNNAKPIDEIGLAKNMHSHYTTFSIGELSGMIRDMAKAIKDNVLQGQPVKLSDLCIFSAHVESDGAKDAVSYDIGKHVKAVKLACQATGDSRRQWLTDEAQLEFSSLALQIRAGQAPLPVKDGKAPAGWTPKNVEGNDEEVGG